jgi:hypothetical protein
MSKVVGMILITTGIILFIIGGGMGLYSLSKGAEEITVLKTEDFKQTSNRTYEAEIDLNDVSDSVDISIHSINGSDQINTSITVRDELNKSKSKISGKTPVLHSFKIRSYERGSYRILVKILSEDRDIEDVKITVTTQRISSMTRSIWQGCILLQVTAFSLITIGTVFILRARSRSRKEMEKERSADLDHEIPLDGRKDSYQIF